MHSLIMHTRCQGFTDRAAPTSLRTTNGKVVRPVRAAAVSSPRVRYSKRAEDEKHDLFYYVGVDPPKDIGQVTNMASDEVQVSLQDLRATDNLTWQSNGFELVHFSKEEAIDWDNEDEVKQEYYPQVEALLKRTTGAARVHIMKHGFRRGKIPRGSLDLAARPQGLQEPAALTHVDFTDASARKALQDHCGAEAEDLSKKPWGIIQIWRPLTGPVQDSPLGLVDAATLSLDDIMKVQVHVPGDIVHEVTFVQHNPNHRWYWTSQMQAHEAYLFVNFDSRNDGRARFTPHGTIVDDSVPKDAPIRQSIETRALVFWDT